MFPRLSRPGQIELELERSADVLLFPERHHKGREPDPQRSQTVDPRMASSAEGNEKPGGVLSRSAVMNKGFSLSATAAAPVAVARQRAFPVAAEVNRRAPSAVIAGPARAAHRWHRATTAQE